MLLLLALAAIGAWLAAPVVRAWLLVAAHPSVPVTPADLAVEDLTFPGPDGALSGWLVRGRPGAPAVVLVHGFKSSREEMVGYARFLSEAGYGVLLFDTRGCGRSDGATIGLGATEPRDISAAVAAVATQTGAAKVAVLGISLGAGAAILAAADDRAIAAVIADSAWTDQDLQLDRLSTAWLGAAAVPLPPYGPAVVSAIVGADVRRARPLEAVVRVAPRPLLLIHSADDANATTPVAGARALFAAAGDPKELWIAPRGGHVGAINTFPEEYRARVLAFLDRALR